MQEELSAEALAGVVNLFAAIGQSQGQKDAQAATQRGVVGWLIALMPVTAGRGRRLLSKA
jgi:hypothetical protein